MDDTPINRNYGLKTDACRPENWMDTPFFAKAMARIYLLTGFTRLSNLEEDEIKALIKKLGTKDFAELLQSDAHWKEFM